MKKNIKNMNFSLTDPMLFISIFEICKQYSEYIKLKITKTIHIQSHMLIYVLEYNIISSF